MGSEDEKKLEQEVFQASILYRTYFQGHDWDNPLTNDFTHQRMLILANHPLTKNKIYSFRRFMIYEDKMVPLDQQDCYLGELVSLDEIKDQDFTSYIDLVGQKEEGEAYQKEIIKDLNGAYRLTKNRHKVFDENLQMVNKPNEKDDYEWKIYELVRAEKEAFQKNTEALKEVNVGTLHFIQRMAKSYACNQN